MHFVLSLFLFVATGCATPDLVAVDAPSADAPPVATESSPPAPQPSLPSPTPPRTPSPSACGPNPEDYTCAGAIGFCPEWRCVDGQWVDVRPGKNPTKKDKWRTVDP